MSAVILFFRRPLLFEPYPKLVAGAGLEPATFWLWARRANRAAPPRNPKILFGDG